MGCMSSKDVVRSVSVRENRNPRVQGGASVTWEELLASHSGSGKLFSFVATKLRSGSFSLPDPETPQEPKFLALVTEINGKTGVEPVPRDAGDPNFSRLSRSRSCQVVRDKDNLGLLDGTDEKKVDWNGRNLAGSRSFHTVEEYDALLERIHKSSTRDVEPYGDYESWDHVIVPKTITLAENQNDWSMELEPGSKEDTNLDDDREGPMNDKTFEKIFEGDDNCKTGWKRKSIAKGLKSLDVTTAAEFPGMVRFRQRYHVEASNIYSPGTYVTPKFGSYNPKAAKEMDGGQEDSVFSPELVAAFEDSVQQLQEEEDSILNHMVEYSRVDDVEHEAKSV